MIFSKRIVLSLSVILLLALVSMVTSCVEEIDLEAPGGLSNNIVIQGRIVFGDEARIEVIVSRLFDFIADSRQTVNVRDVILIDDDGNGIEFFFSRLLQ